MYPAPLATRRWRGRELQSPTGQCQADKDREAQQGRSHLLASPSARTPMQRTLTCWRHPGGGRPRLPPPVELLVPPVTHSTRLLSTNTVQFVVQSAGSQSASVTQGVPGFRSARRWMMNVSPGLLGQPKTTSEHWTDIRSPSMARDCVLDASRTMPAAITPLTIVLMVLLSFVCSSWRCAARARTAKPTVEMRVRAQRTLIPGNHSQAVPLTKARQDTRLLARRGKLCELDAKDHWLWFLE